jgi:hypothetical protein
MHPVSPSTIAQPEELRISLFPHQRASVHQLEKLEREQIVDTPVGFQETRLGAFADIPGYGKGMSLVSLVLRDVMPWDCESPFVYEIVSSSSAGIICNRVRHQHRRLPATLLIADHPIVAQWVDDFELTPLNIHVVASEKDLARLKIEECDVVIVVPTFYNKLAERFTNCAWKRLIYDEAAHTKIPAMKEIIAGFYWFVSATPSAICDLNRNASSSHFMKKIIGSGDWDFDCLFQKMIIRNPPEFVRQSFNMPETFFHDVEYVPGPGNPQLAVSDGILKMAKEDLTRALSLIGGRALPDICDTLDRKTLSHIQERLQNPCNICLETLTNPVAEQSCANLFCGLCLLRWLQKNNKCPTCRAIVHPSSLICVKPTQPSEFTPKSLNFVETIRAIVLAKPNGSFIFFYHENHTFELVRNTLSIEGISWTFVSGNMNEKEESVRRFKDGSARVIFLSTSYSGAGLNLQTTTDILFLCQATSDTQAHIIARANRIGRTFPLHVHRLAET